jgi:hypothetical protein
VNASLATTHGSVAVGVGPAIVVVPLVGFGFPHFVPLLLPKTAAEHAGTRLADRAARVAVLKTNDLIAKRNGSEKSDRKLDDRVYFHFRDSRVLGTAI